MNDAERIKALSDIILQMQDIDQETINFMAKGQNYTKHPNLALVYYHLCSSDPNAYVWNDETLIGEEGKPVRERLLKAFGEPVGENEAAVCQESVARNDTSTGEIRACASCNEIILGSLNEIVERTWDQLHPSFLLTDDQVTNLEGYYPDTIRDFISVMLHNGDYYHLNPDLVPDEETIYLCQRCSKDPTDYPFSLASGHDYGRLKHFPKLSGMTLNTIIPVRNYNINIMLRPNHATGHSICFPSSGPMEAAKELPCHDITRLPQVTFLGPKDKWRIAQKKWRHVYDVNVVDAYKALHIWTDLKNPNFDGVTVVDSAETQEQLAKIADCVEECMIYSESDDIVAMSQFVDAEEEKDTATDDDLTRLVRVDDTNDHCTVQRQLVHSAVLPKPSLATAGPVSGIQALLHIMKPNKNDAELPQDEPEDGGMTQLMRDEIAKQDRRRATGSRSLYIDDGQCLDASDESDDNCNNKRRRATIGSSSIFNDEGFLLEVSQDSNDDCGINIDRDDVDEEQQSDDDTNIDLHCEILEELHSHLDATVAEDQVKDTAQSNTSVQRPVIAVLRDKDPIIEWNQNDVMFGGAFPHLFLLGKGIPKGELTLKFLKHCFKFYDGRFEDPLWIATAFNQKQRHACIRKTAKVGSGSVKTLQTLGRLSSNKAFRELLVKAVANPTAEKSKKLNAKICRTLSLVGSAVPFSPFERVRTRPMLNAMRLRYSTATMFHTGSPPEFEDLTTLRLCLIENFNDKNCTFAKGGFKREQLPDNVRENTGMRLKMTVGRPVLGAQAFMLKHKLLNNDIIRCPVTADYKYSRNYTERESGAFGRVAAHNTVIEPQKGGRLHWHKSIYFSGLIPTLMNRLAAGPQEFLDEVGSRLASVSCTSLSERAHIWYNGLDMDSRPRAADIPVPDASSQYEEYMYAAERKSLLTNIHQHGHSCEKTRKGQQMCRMAMPRGVHTQPTCPLFVKALTLGDTSKGIRPKFVSCEVVKDKSLQQELDSPVDHSQGQLLPDHLNGTVVWELYRPEEDKLLVEPNTHVSNLIQCHNNAALMTSMNAGEAVEQYAANYMTKEGAPLRQAASVLLAAVDHIAHHPSKAEDSGTLQRVGKHMAQRTINTFAGSHQWSTALMVYALSGYKSFATTEAFRFVFPHDNVSYYKNMVDADSNDDGDTKMDSLEGINIDNQNASIEELLESMGDCDNNGFIGGGGATAYKVGDKCIFLNQADSYANRGSMFELYSQLEFEMIVELLPKKVQKKDKTGPGRPSRVGFDLGYNHPLYKSHQGFLRMKMNTAILGGRPPPHFPGNRPREDTECAETNEKIEKKWKTLMDAFAHYIFCLFVPWTPFETPMLSFDAKGLAQLKDQWDRSTAPLLCRQRIRMIINLMMQGNRNNHNENVSSAWRERNADWWIDLKADKGMVSHTDPLSCEENKAMDLEASGQLTAEETFTLSNKIVEVLQDRSDSVCFLRERCSELHGIGKQPRDIPNSQNACSCIVLQRQDASDPEGDQHNQPQLSLREMIDQIHTMGQELEDPEVGNVAPANGDSGPMESDSGVDSTHQTEESGKTCSLTEEQEEIVSEILEGIKANPSKQSLLLLHSGGGTGKSTVVRDINRKLTLRGYTQANCCPTGVGATHLPKGRTLHSLFKISIEDLAANNQIDEMKKSLGGDRLRLVVVDEVSMLDAKHFVLLDSRLKTMYKHDQVFGGISILLLGDFVQLPAIGHLLCSCMYLQSKNVHVEARALFMKFKVRELTKQLRAATCVDQQRRLESMRKLPSTYPASTTGKWPKDFHFQPVTQDVVDGLTQELTVEEVMSDERWTTDAVCITPGNMDRSIINAAVACIYGQKKGQTVIKWRKQLDREYPLFMSNMLYNEDSFPELYGYFVHGAPGQILDNGNGNVSHGVANGTPCKMVSIAFDDPVKELEVVTIIERGWAEGHTNEAILIPHAPDFLIVEVDVPNSAKWPNNLNLSGKDGIVHIPIGLKARKGKKNPDMVKVGKSDTNYVGYLQHAVDLAFAITPWKSQGGTYDYVIALLESSPNSPAMSYEMVYVMLSRVRSSSRFRCFPLINRKEVVKKLKNLRPNIWSTRWRMDIGEDGYWHQNESSTIKGRKRRFESKAAKAKRQCKTQMVPKEASKEKIYCRNAKPVHSVQHAQPVGKGIIQKAARVERVRKQDGASTFTQTATTSQRERSMSTHTGLPIQDNRYLGIPFTERGLASLRHEQWLNDEVIDLFSIMDVEQGNDVYYLSTTAYTHYFDSLERNEDTAPEIFGGGRRRHQRDQQRETIQSKKIWLVPVCDNNHWQILCFINQEECFAILMDSMLRTTRSMPANYEKCCLFAAALTSQVYEDNLHYRTQGSVPVDIGVVALQPNGCDCGVFALLNLKHVVRNVQHLSMLQHSPTGHRFQRWYTDTQGVEHRRILREAYSRMLDEYGVENTPANRQDENSGILRVYN